MVSNSQHNAKTCRRNFSNYNPDTYWSYPHPAKLSFLVDFSIADASAVWANLCRWY